MRKLRADIATYYQLADRPMTVSAWRILVACFNPRLLPVVLLRISSFFYYYRFGFLARFFTFLNIFLFGIEVSPRVKIGGGLFLPHTVGTVIGAESIGENVTIMQGVTLGAKEPDMHFNAETRPVIGNHVLIGAGAKVIGRITVGDYVKIGANAVVVDDIPAHAVAVGIPARVIKSFVAD